MFRIRKQPRMPSPATAIGLVALVGALGVALTVFLAAGTIAQAASGPGATIALHRTLRQSANYPDSGSSAVYAGVVRTHKLGRGAIIQTITITAHPSDAIFKFRGTSTAYYPRGTAKSTFTGTGTLQPDGRFTLVGRGQYAGGTLYRHRRGKYSFTATAPPPPPPSPCAVPAGWRTVASDADLVVILDQSPPVQEYRYCDYADPSRGFQLLVHSDSCGLEPSVTCSTVAGVALSYVLYDSWTAVDSPGCGGPNPTTDGTSTVFAVDTGSGNTVTLAHGQGGITSAQLSPPGVGAWILTYDQCPFTGGNQRTEALESYSFRTGAVTTLDTGDSGETISSRPSLASLQLYQCGAGCPANTVVIAWTHDGTWRYQQFS
jgi:hypothetical protein